MKIPINIVMGELGSGKTTVILSLVRQIAGPHHLVIWLKNEYGDVNVDAKLGKEAGITTQEIMNGCLCCTALGNIEDAVEKVLEMKPDRIIIETAGTAHPAPIVMELKRFPSLVMDSVVEVVDVLNFRGFKEPEIIRASYSHYVDFVVVNKIGLVDERRLDDVMDGVLGAYSDTPIIRTADGSVSARAVIGLDGGSVSRDALGAEMDALASSGGHEEMQAFSFRSVDGVFDPQRMTAAVESLDKKDVYRVKGIVRTPEGWQVLNGVASRVTWQAFGGEAEQTELLFVGPRAAEREEEAVRMVGEAMVRWG